MKKLIAVITFYIGLSVIIVNAQTIINLNENIPLNPKVKTGVLENGMKYYVMQNKKPENRAELRLVVNVGSTQENDDQQGLAHFTEHMAFNGTKNFKKNDLIDYLQSVGVRFGADVNAYTSFDETVYMLSIPTDSAQIMDKAFMILEDWAHNVTFDSVEIDKERGVVIEEWRLGQGADERMRRQYWPVVFENSRYAERYVIGKKEILQNCSYETLRSFYRDWYRPEIMSVIVVGDIDADQTVDRIKKQFGSIPKKENPRALQSFTIPDNEKIIIAKATDNEATSTDIEIIYKLPKEVIKTAGDYKKNLIRYVYAYLLSMRLSELKHSAEPPFVNAYTRYSDMLSWTRARNSFTLFATVKDGGIEKGMEAILTENQRVKKYGYTQTELDRVKNEILRYTEIQYNERDKTESKNFTYGLVNNYLTGDANPGIEYKYDFYRQQLPGITLDEINSLSEEWKIGENPVVIITGPDKDGVSMPTDDAVVNIINESASKDITQYTDEVSINPLLKTIPAPGKVVGESLTEQVGIIRWKLSNGATVVLKPTDFKNDEIQFNSFSFGGSSLYSEKDYLDAALCAWIINNGGLGDFNSIELQKVLSGKAVQVYTDIDDITQGISGSCSPKDAQTMFEMIYLYFTDPNKNKTDFDANIDKYRVYLQNRSSDPNEVFRDTIRATMGQYNYHSMPIDEEKLNQIDFNRVYEIYKERFSDPSGFTFMFVGNFNPESIKPLVEQYIGGIPSGSKNETYKDVGIRAPKGIIEKSVKKGIEPKTSVNIAITGPFNFSRSNARGITLLISLLNIKLIEQMREEKSEVYGVGVWGDYSLYPQSTYQINFGWGCAPENADGLVKIMWNEINKIKADGCDDKDLRKVSEEAIRKYEINIKDNAWWLNLITGREFEKKDILDILEYPDYINNLKSEDFKRLANQYLSKDNVATFVLIPEK